VIWAILFHRRYFEISVSQPTKEVDRSVYLPNLGRS
jgi:hypothetical protein